MEQLQVVDEDLFNLILEFDLLDLNNPQEHTKEKVANAIEFSLQLGSSEELLSIAVLRSTNQLDQDALARHVGHEERNRLLAQSAPSSPTPDDQNAPDGGECIICSASHGPKRHLPCGCWYCPACLRMCIRAGLTPGGWPPRCCNPLTEDDIEWVQRPGLLELYRQTREENETSASERLYCARAGCASFIPTNGDDDNPACPACGEQTCKLCRSRKHPGRPCAIEEEDELLMDMMDENNLGSCPQCQRIVELRDGCNHISCECGFDWCFLCGQQWTGRNHPCPMYQNLHMRVPARERQQRFRQGRHEGEHIPRRRPQLVGQQLEGPRPELPFPAILYDHEAWVQYPIPPEALQPPQVLPGPALPIPAVHEAAPQPPRERRRPSPPPGFFHDDSANPHDPELDDAMQAIEYDNRPQANQWDQRNQNEGRNQEAFARDDLPIADRLHQDGNVHDREAFGRHFVRDMAQPAADGDGDRLRLREVRGNDRPPSDGLPERLPGQEAVPRRLRVDLSARGGEGGLRGPWPALPGREQAPNRPAGQTAVPRRLAFDRLAREQEDGLRGPWPALPMREPVPNRPPGQAAVPAPALAERARRRRGGHQRNNQPRRGAGR